MDFILNWIVIKLMEYQVRKVQKQLDRQKNPIFKKAILMMLSSYRTSLGFLEANKRNKK